MSIGRLTDQKNQITILKSLNVLKKKEINFRFFLIGAGYKLKILKKYVKDNQLVSHIKFGGYKKNAHDYIRSSDLFVLSSKYEGLPNVLIEAQQFNIPIISSNCPSGPSEILMNGKLGALYPVGDYKKLYKEIIQFYYNKKKLIQKSNLAIQYLNRFDKQANCNEYYKIIKKYI